MPTSIVPNVPPVSFANLICRFGDRFVLLDFANEVILPAFLDASLERKFGNTVYFFFQVAVAEIPVPNESVQPQLVVHGRLVKDTLLTREQVFVQGQGLIPAEGSMPSAPSSFFALILNNHKLIYLPETAHAPTLGMFEATLQKFLSLKYKAYTDALYDQLKSSPQRKPKRQIHLEIPHPTVEVLPLASRASVEEFLRAFEKVTHLEFRILETNQEFQM